MKTIYIDLAKHCHVTDDGTMTAIQDVFFENKCDAFVEGYCYDDSKGYPHIYPWKPYDELKEAQYEYEQKLLNEYKNKVNELNASYNEGINSI